MSINSSSRGVRDEKVFALIADILSLGPADIARDLTPDNADNWDSFAMLRMILAIEQDFAVTFSAREIEEGFVSVGAICDVLSSRL